MKKIPTLFKRVYENHKVVDILDEITPGCERCLKKVSLRLRSTAAAQGNPYNLGEDKLEKHVEAIVKVERTFDGIKKWLEEHNEEGLVFWLDGEPVCKIKRTDFGLEWPIKKGE